MVHELKARIASAASFAGLCTILVLALSASSGVHPLAIQAPTGRGLTTQLSPSEPFYPDEWRTDLADVSSRANFEVVLPPDSAVGGQSPFASYVWPDGNAVAFDYAPLASPKGPVRQEYIEVWQGEWEGQSPEAELKAQVEASDVRGQYLTEINGTIALVVEPYSPDDIDGANAAFVEFIVGRVQFEISGGDDLEALVAIADSILEALKTG